MFAVQMNAVPRSQIGGEEGYERMEFQNGRTIYVVDDSADVRKSLHKLLGAMDINAYPFRSGGDFLDGLPDLKPAPILVDIRVPEIDGLELMGELRRRENAWPIIAMTGHGEVPIAVKAMRLGAIEFLSKPFEVEALESALDLAFGALRDTVMEERQRDAAAVRFAALTQREREITDELVAAHSNKEIARTLDLSVRTVEMHRANAMRKLGVSNIVELVALLATATGGKDAYRS
jgi:two-component system response regulator FixJ